MLAKEDEFKYRYHEVCIKDRIPPEDILGCYYEKKDKETALVYLRREGMITKKDGVECVNHIPVNEFFVEVKKMTPELMMKIRMRNAAYIRNALRPLKSKL